MAISRVVIERSRFHDIIEDRAIHLHTHLQDPKLKVVHLQQPALSRTVALMRAPQALPPLIESCFTLMVDTLRTK